MGSHSDYSDDEHDKKRRNRTSRHSPSRSRSRERHRDRKSVKSKHRDRSRSRSTSSGKHTRQSCSRSTGEHGSRRRGHERSRSRSRSRSDSRTKRHSKSHQSQSGKKSKDRSRDSSRSSRSRDSRRTHGDITSDRIKIESSDAGHDGMTNAQQQELKLQMAMRAAVAADEVLRAQGIVLTSSGVRPQAEPMSFEDQQRRASAISDIDNSDFVQSSFKSTRSEIPLPSGSAVDASHAGAIFGSVNAVPTPLHGVQADRGTSLVSLDGDSLMHPNLYVGVDEKMERWKNRLMELRRKKLQSGTVNSIS